MKITVTRDIGGHSKGDTIEVIDSIGTRLVERGAAAEVKTRGRSKSDDSE